MLKTYQTRFRVDSSSGSGSGSGSDELIRLGDVFAQVECVVFVRG